MLWVKRGKGEIIQHGFMESTYQLHEYKIVPEVEERP